MAGHLPFRFGQFLAFHVAIAPVEVIVLTLKNAKPVLMALVQEVSLRALFFALFVFASNAFAAQIEKLNFKDEQLIGSRRVVLNGLGVHAEKKRGKMFVTALYTPSKTADAPGIVNSNAPKIVEIVFLRAIDRESLQELWSENVRRHCGEECSAVEEQLKAFNGVMVDVHDNSRLKMVFDPSGVSVEIKGAKSDSAVIDGEPFRRALLSVFVGEKPLSADLKKALIGGA